jgi:hypothetical protein
MPIEKYTPLLRALDQTHKPGGRRTNDWWYVLRFAGLPGTSGLVSILNVITRVRRGSGTGKTGQTRVAYPNNIVERMNYFISYSGEATTQVPRQGPSYDVYVVSVTFKFRTHGIFELERLEKIIREILSHQPGRVNLHPRRTPRTIQYGPVQQSIPSGDPAHLQCTATSAALEIERYRCGPGCTLR